MGNRFSDVQDAPQTCRPGSACDLSRNNQMQDNNIFQQIQRDRCSNGSCGVPNLQITDCSSGTCRPRSGGGGYSGGDSSYSGSDGACSGKVIHPSDNSFGGKAGYDAAVSKVTPYDHKNFGDAMQKAAASGNGVAYMVVSESTRDSQKLLTQMSQMKEQNPGMQFVTIDKDKVAADLKANPNDKNAQNWQKWIDQSTNGTNLAFTSLQSVKPGADGRAMADKVVSTHWGGDIKDSLQDQNRFAQKFTGAYKDQFKFSEGKDGKPETKGDAVDGKPKENLSVDEIKGKLGENKDKPKEQKQNSEESKQKPEDQKQPEQKQDQLKQQEQQKQPEQKQQEQKQEKQEAQKPEPPKPEQIKSQLFSLTKAEHNALYNERRYGNHDNFSKRQTEVFNQATEAAIKSGQDLVVNFEMFGCGPCNNKKDQAIPQMQKMLDGRAQILNFDGANEQTSHLLSKFGMNENSFPNGFPTTGIFKYDANTNKFVRQGEMINGYYNHNPEQFLNQVRARYR